MSIRTIKNSESLDSLWDELVYTEARMLKDPDAKDLVAPITALIKRWEKVDLGQRSAWRAEIVAQAWVDAENENLDETVGAVSDGLLVVTRKDRNHPRYRRYFKKTASEVIRMGLQSELEVVRSWPQSLKTEPEAALSTLGAELEKNVTEGDAAVEARSAAATHRTDHRLREIVRLIDDANGTRRSLYGQLITRGEEKGRPADWASRFFQKTTTSAPRAVPAPATAAIATAAAGGEPTPPADAHQK